jgi:hypothetical protein
VKEKTIFDFPFHVAFVSDGIPEATKDVHVQTFPSRSNSCKLYKRIPGNF